MEPKLYYEEIDSWKYHLTDRSGPCSYDSGIKIEEEIDVPWINMTESGLVTCKVGFSWNGPSGPAFDTPTFMRGSMFHDALYALMRAGHLDQSYRHDVDYMMDAINKEAGMWKPRRMWVLRGVRLFAAGASKRKERVVLSAP